MLLCRACVAVRLGAVSWLLNLVRTACWSNAIG